LGGQMAVPAVWVPALTRAGTVALRAQAEGFPFPKPDIAAILGRNNAEIFEGAFNSFINRGPAKGPVMTLVEAMQYARDLVAKNRLALGSEMVEATERWDEEFRGLLRDYDSGFPPEDILRTLSIRDVTHGLTVAEREFMGAVEGAVRSPANKLAARSTGEEALIVNPTSEQIGNAIALGEVKRVLPDGSIEVEWEDGTPTIETNWVQMEYWPPEAAKQEGLQEWGGIHVGRKVTGMEDSYDIVKALTGERASQVTRYPIRRRSDGIHALVDSSQGLVYITVQEIAPGTWEIIGIDLPEEGDF